MSHPVWVRGLKLPLAAQHRAYRASHPVWVRGLKQYRSHMAAWLVVVAPRVGAWIETDLGLLAKAAPWVSHPVWVRGLKPVVTSELIAEVGVAPRVGAWIETA